MMRIFGALGGAAIGAVIGAALWLIVAFATGYEVGWIAIALGGLAGLGTKIGGRGINGALGGVIAGAFALGAIAIAKLIMFSALTVAGAMPGSHDRDEWVLSNLEQLAMFEAGDPMQAMELAQQRFTELSPEDLRTYRGYPPAMGPDRPKVVLAYQLIDAADQAGTLLEWPAGQSLNTAWLKQHFPKSIWSDVEKRWPSLPAAQRQAYSDYVASETRQHVDEYYRLPDNEDSAQAGVLSLYDILWVVLAVGAAYRLGTTTDE